MTRNWITIAGIIAVLAAAPGLVPTASADHGEWVFGAGVRIGDFEFNIGYAPTRYGPQTYYYATHDHIDYDDYHCTDRCYRRSRTDYHHESCPVLLHLFHVHRIHPHRLYVRYAPRYDGRWDRYDPYDWHRSYRSDRHDRYDDRHWRDRRYDRHDRRYDRYDRRHDRRDRWHDRHDRRHDRRDRRHDRRHGPGNR